MFLYSRPVSTRRPPYVPSPLSQGLCPPGTPGPHQPRPLATTLRCQTRRDPLPARPPARTRSLAPTLEGRGSASPCPPATPAHASSRGPRLGGSTGATALLTLPAPAARAPSRLPGHVYPLATMRFCVLGVVQAHTSYASALLLLQAQYGVATPCVETVRGWACTCCGKCRSGVPIGSGLSTIPCNGAPRAAWSSWEFPKPTCAPTVFAWAMPMSVCWPWRWSSIPQGTWSSGN